MTDDLQQQTNALYKGRECLLGHPLTEFITDHMERMESDPEPCERCGHVHGSTFGLCGWRETGAAALDYCRCPDPSPLEGVDLSTNFRPATIQYPVGSLANPTIADARKFLAHYSRDMESNPMFNPSAPHHVCSIIVAAENAESLVNCSCGKRFIVTIKQGE